MMNAVAVDRAWNRLSAEKQRCHRSGEYVPLFRDMIKWMVDEGMYIQWYDSIGDAGSISYQNVFNDYNDGWLWNSEDGNVANSIFLNYWYSSSALKNSKAHHRRQCLRSRDSDVHGRLSRRPEPGVRR